MENKCVQDIYLLIKSCIIAFFVVFLHSKIFYNERFDNYIMGKRVFLDITFCLLLTGIFCPIYAETELDVSSVIKSVEEFVSAKEGASAGDSLAGSFDTLPESFLRLLEIHSRELEREIGAREKAEAHERAMVRWLYALSIIIIIILAFMVYAWMSRREIARKNRALAWMINTQLEAAKGRKYGKKGEYESLCKLVIDGKLYKDVTLDRESVAAQLGIGRHALNQLLNDKAGGMSFPQWINAIRIDQACKIMHDSKELTVNEIADAVGLTPDNFRRLFKQRYGMSPSEYKQVEEK